MRTMDFPGVAVSVLYCTRAPCGKRWGSNVIVWREAPGHIVLVLHAAGWVPGAGMRAKWFTESCLFASFVRFFLSFYPAVLRPRPPFPSHFRPSPFPSPFSFPPLPSLPFPSLLSSPRLSSPLPSFSLLSILFPPPFLLREPKARPIRLL